jgi:hypothetical protein
LLQAMPTNNKLAVTPMAKAGMMFFTEGTGLDSPYNAHPAPKLSRLRPNFYIVHFPQLIH